MTGVHDDPHSRLVGSNTSFLTHHLILLTFEETGSMVLPRPQLAFALVRAMQSHAV